MFDRDTWPGACNALRQLKREAGSFAVFAFHADGTHHQMQQLLTDGKSEAGAFQVAVAFAV